VASTGLSRLFWSRLRVRDRRALARRLDNLSERLSHWSINLSPRALSLQEGLRAAFACALVVALMEWRHLPALSWAAIAALWTCLADPGGATRRRFKVLMGYSAVSTLFAMAGLGLPWAAATLFICTLLGGAASVWGPAARQAGVLALVACAVAIDSPKVGPAAILQFGAVFAAGCLWATFLSLTIWRIHPFRPARHAASDMFQAMAALVADLGARASERSGSTAEAAGWARVTTRRRAAVRSAIEASRTAIDELLRAQREGPVVDRLMLALAMAERIFTELIALDDIVQSPTGPGERRLRVRQIRLISVMLRRMAMSLRAPLPDHFKAEARLAALMPDHSWAGSPELEAIAADLLDFDLVEAAPPRVRPQDKTVDLFAPLLAELHVRSALSRHVFRGAVLVTGVLIVVHSLGLPKSYWATMALILVHQSQLATTWPRALERSLGSVLGGAIAVLIGWLFVTPVLLTIAVFPLAMLTMAMRRVNYALFVMFLTPLFVLVSELAQPGSSHVVLAWYRVANNVLGCAVALVGASLLWPAKERLRLRATLAEAIVANGRYAVLAFRTGADPAVRDAARRAAGLASANAERSCDRVALETPRGGGGLEEAAAILVMLRQLTGGATVAWLHPAEDAPPGDAVADWLGPAVTELAGAVRGGAIPAESRPPGPALADPTQAQAVHRVALLRQGVVEFVAARGGMGRKMSGLGIARPVTRGAA